MGTVPSWLVKLEAVLIMLFASVRSEILFGLLILLNAFFMCVEIQYQGFDNARSVSYHGRTRSAEDTWPGAAEVFYHVGQLCGYAFLVECVGKICLYRRRFFVATPWNGFDVIVVLAWCGEAWVPEAKGTGSSMLRALRLFRLMRLLRLVRFLKIFGPIHLILRSIQASVLVLFWSLMLLVLVISIIAMAMSQTLTSFIRDDAQDMSARMDVYEGWGSFTRAVISIFEVTLANWGPPCWLLTNHVNENWFLFFLIYKCSVGFAVVQVILSVFIQQTFKVAARDERVMIHEKESASKAYYSNLENLFRFLDTSGDGLLTYDELQDIVNSREVGTWFASVGLELDEITDLFEMLDTGSGTINQDEFIAGVKCLHGNARSVDLFVLKREIARINCLVTQIHEDFAALRGSHPCDGD
eukprot:NODE_676_length_1411_cov_340.638643.p1 GENE.NODE_676_length_1411_cov_340.638643~~NODE_676_length_1411_cov_340.638643.p1  ORF type:complete len:413 (+),score=153.89 NODE_676_length_1411_cov_340.638643:3-1241(+)